MEGGWGVGVWGVWEWEALFILDLFHIVGKMAYGLYRAHVIERIQTLPDLARGLVFHVQGHRCRGQEKE